MTIEEVIDRAVMLRQTIEIEYCTRSGSVFTSVISDIVYSPYYGGQCILAYREDIHRGAADIQDQQDHESERTLFHSYLLVSIRRLF